MLVFMIKILNLMVKLGIETIAASAIRLRIMKIRKK